MTRSTVFARSALVAAVVVLATISHTPAAAQRGGLLRSVAQIEEAQDTYPKAAEPRGETAGRRPPLFGPIDVDDTEEESSAAVDETEEEPAGTDDAAVLKARMELIELQIEEMKKELSFLRAEIRELKVGGGGVAQTQERNHRTAPFWLVE